MLRYQKLFEYYNGEDTVKGPEPKASDKFIDQINNAIKVVKDRYEASDYMRTVKGRSVSLATYLPTLQKELSKDFQTFVEYSNELDGDLYAGFFIPSVAKFKADLEDVEKSETAPFNPSVSFEVFQVDSSGKVVDPRRKEQFKDSAYVGKKVPSDLSDESIEAMFKDDTL